MSFSKSPTAITHDASTYAYFPVFSSPSATVKLLKTLEIRVLKRLASAAQLRPGHHVFNELGEILKPPSTAKKPSIVGGNDALGEERPSFILIECHRFAAMRRVEERSLSSILRSKLLTTLISNDVSGRVNARGLREFFGQFDAMQMCFRVWIGGEKSRSDTGRSGNWSVDAGILCPSNSALTMPLPALVRDDG